MEEDIKMLCEWKKCELQEMSVKNDHIHLVVLIPPKVSISEMMGILKGKLAIKLFKSYPKMKQKPYWEIISGREGILSVPLESTKTRYVTNQIRIPHVDDMANEIT